VSRESTLDGLNRHFDPGAEAARFGKYHFFNSHVSVSSLEESPTRVKPAGLQLLMTTPLGD
jgi:hypothetical protein